MSNIVSLMFYLSAFFLSAGLMYYGHRRGNKVFVGLSLSIPITIGALRYGVGTDYFNYIALYENFSSLSFSQYLTNGIPEIEFGFFLLIKLSELITNSPLFLFASSVALTITFFYIGLVKYKIKHTVLVYLLFLLIIFPITLNIVRQGIAIAICFYALTFLIERRFIAYTLWILTASLFHMTALFLLPLYLLNLLIKKGIKNNYLPFLLKLGAISLGIYLLLPYVFQLLATIPSFEKYEKYQMLVGEGNNYILYLQLALLVAIIGLSKWTILREDVLNKYLFLLAFAIFELILTTLGFASSFIKRVALYFSIFPIILLTNVTDIFSDKLGRSLTYFIVISYGVLYFYLAYYHLDQADIIPYKLIGVQL